MKSITEFLTEQLQINEQQLNEKEIKNEDEFREYAMNMCKEAHGDDYNEDKAKEAVDDFLKDHEEEVKENKWGELVGIWNKGFAK